MLQFPFGDLPLLRLPLRIDSEWRPTPSSLRGRRYQASDVPFTRGRKRFPARLIVVDQSTVDCCQERCEATRIVLCVRWWSHETRTLDGTPLTGCMKPTGLVTAASRPRLREWVKGQGVLTSTQKHRSFKLFSAFLDERARSPPGIPAVGLGARSVRAEITNIRAIRSGADIVLPEG